MYVYNNMTTALPPFVPVHTAQQSETGGNEKLNAWPNIQRQCPHTPPLVETGYDSLLFPPYKEEALEMRRRKIFSGNGLVCSLHTSPSSGKYADSFQGLQYLSNMVLDKIPLPKNISQHFGRLASWETIIRKNYPRRFPLLTYIFSRGNFLPP